MTTPQLSQDELLLTAIRSDGTPVVLDLPSGTELGRFGLPNEKYISVIMNYDRSMIISRSGTYNYKLWIHPGDDTAHRD